MKKGDIVKWKYPMSELELKDRMEIVSVFSQNIVIVKHSDGHIGHELVSNLSPLNPSK